MPNIGEYVCEMFSFGDNIRRYWRKRLSPGAELGHTKTPNHADGNGAQCVCAVCPAFRPYLGAMLEANFLFCQKGRKLSHHVLNGRLGVYGVWGFYWQGRQNVCFRRLLTLRVV